MSKSILVIDTPKSCLDCQFCREMQEGIEACCELSDEPNDKELCRMIDVGYCQEKPDWCPLRDLPEKKFDIGNSEGLYPKDYRYGWNECIDEILKGADGNE